MPKRKVRQSNRRAVDYIQTLMNLNFLHSPCASDKCEVDYQHCSGCNESYPCKSAQVLAGKSVAQLNRQIDEMGTFTISGDQAVEVVEEDGDEENVSES